MPKAGLKLVVATLLCALAAPPARAEVRILGSMGGRVGPFIDLFDEVRASGQRVVIDGPCMSACTLVLSVVPNDRICVTRRAVLGFHAAIDGPARPIICRAGSLRACAGGLSRRGAGLDQAPRRIVVAAVVIARPRTRRDLSVVPLKQGLVS
jgi:hypothetical protein